MTRREILSKPNIVSLFLNILIPTTDIAPILCPGHAQLEIHLLAIVVQNKYLPNLVSLFRLSTSITLPTGRNIYASHRQVAPPLPQIPTSFSSLCSTVLSVAPNTGFTKLQQLSGPWSLHQIPKRPMHIQWYPPPR